jgi:hypothetical protein
VSNFSPSLVSFKTSPSLLPNSSTLASSIAFCDARSIERERRERERERELGIELG